VASSDQVEFDIGDRSVVSAVIEEGFEADDNTCKLAAALQVDPRELLDANVLVPPKRASR
jgi:hypothetical protein